MSEFLWYLTALTVCVVVVTLADTGLHYRARRLNLPWVRIGWLEFIKSLCTVLVLVWLLRAFVVEPYTVPTGSLQPSIQPIEYVLINHLAYGIHSPLRQRYLWQYSQPQRGDIVLFRWPANEEQFFIKRAIGLPGDVISYHNKQLTINGKVMSQQFVETLPIDNDNDATFSANRYHEQLFAKTHDIVTCASKQCPNPNNQDFDNLKVPAGQVFVMGDNRDNSDDSRGWGFVPMGNIVGKGEIVLLSWDKLAKKPRWSRFFTRL